MTLDPAWLREDWAKYDAERKGGGRFGVLVTRKHAGLIASALSDQSDPFGEEPHRSYAFWSKVASGGPDGEQVNARISRDTLDAAKTAMSDYLDSFGGEEDQAREAPHDHEALNRLYAAKGIAEAELDEASGAERTKWDDMHEDELRKHIAKFKAMGDKAPAVPMLRATQALARKVALNESWEQWDLHRKLGGYAGMKSGPWGAGKDSPGRGPTGKLRNFKSMSDAKLHATVGALQIHGEDHEAHEAAQAEWLKRHPVAKKPKQLSL